MGINATNNSLTLGLAYPSHMFM